MTYFSTPKLHQTSWQMYVHVRPLRKISMRPGHLICLEYPTPHLCPQPSDCLGSAPNLQTAWGVAGLCRGRRSLETHPRTSLHTTETTWALGQSSVYSTFRCLSTLITSNVFHYCCVEAIPFNRSLETSPRQDTWGAAFSFNGNDKLGVIPPLQRSVPKQGRADAPPSGRP